MKQQAKAFKWIISKVNFVYLKSLMTKKALINKTLKTISQLPQDKIREVNDFADFMLKKYDEEVLRKGIERLASDSKAFDFLEEEKQQEQEQEQEQDGHELYLPEDLKEQYN